MSEKWIIPCNTKFFDINEHLKHNDTVVWKNSFTIKKGDVVYIYLGAPYRLIKYKGCVVSDEVSEELLDQHSYAKVEKKSNNYFSKKIKYIQIKIEGVFNDNAITYEALKDHGLGQVQIQARIPRGVLYYIQDVEKNQLEVLDYAH